MGSWYSGNAADDGANTRGWILGHFLDPSARVRSTKTSKSNGASTQPVTSEPSGSPATSAPPSSCSFKATSTSNSAKATPP